MLRADAVGLVLYAFKQQRRHLCASASCDHETLARSYSLMGKPEHPVDIIGTRHGEKLYEVLSREELACAEDMGNYFRVPPDGRDLNYGKFIDKGDTRLTLSAHGQDYNSQHWCDVEGMTKLMKLESMKRISRGEMTTVSADSMKVLITGTAGFVGKIFSGT